jgi:hypothetical protein
MPELNAANVLDSFDFRIPGAAGRGNEYLRTVRQIAERESAPVTASVREVSAAAGFTSTNKLLCLVLTPKENRLRHYYTLHYGTDIGTALQVGWYLVGGERAMGKFDMPVLGGPSHADVENVKSIVAFIAELVVVPAIHAMSGQAPPGRRGFFGA